MEGYADLLRPLILDALSYLLFLVGGCVVAFHLDQVHAAEGEWRGTPAALRFTYDGQPG